MQLYDYFRSSAAYRVRLALAYKGLGYESIPVHLVQDGGVQHSSWYQELNPQGLVPSLVVESQTLTQSLAIIDYLEQRYPDSSSLWPKDLAERSRVVCMSQLIACDVHPLNNLRVLNYLKDELGVSEAERKKWYQHWVQLGFVALEAMLEQEGAQNYCVGSSFTLADCCLVPQVYNALRFDCPMQDFAHIQRIYNFMISQDFVQDARPEHRA